MAGADQSFAEFSLGIEGLKTPVVVDNGRQLGWRISEPGATFNLGPVFTQGRDLLNKGLGYELYLKTGGMENIYHLGYNSKSGSWEIEGKNQSIAAEKRLVAHLTRKDELRLGLQPCTIGKGLENFGGWNTTGVVEIVLMERGFREPEQLRQTTGNSSNIVENFREKLRGLPQPPA